MFDLSEKIVLITGGASGIGFSCAKEILRAGARGVAIVDLQEDKGEAALKDLTDEFGCNRALFIKADVTKQDNFEEAFKATLGKWNQIDVLINNAGIFNDKQYELEIAVNVTSITHGTLLGIEYMSKQNGGKGGVIANISSTLGLHEKTAFPIYAGTKHFIIGFSRSMGTPYHYDRSGVKIVTVCPGFTVTPLSDYNSSTDTVFLFPDLAKFFAKECENAVKQPPELVAASVITSITKGKSGSVWVADKNEYYEVDLPDGRLFRK